MGKLKTRIDVVLVAMIVLSMVLAPVATAIPTAPMITYETELCGGGDDGEINCDWKLLAGCIITVGVPGCGKDCGICAATPAKWTCIWCVVCAGSAITGCTLLFCK